MALQDAACRAHRVACRAALRGVDFFENGFKIKPCSLQLAVGLAAGQRKGLKLQAKFEVCSHTRVQALEELQLAVCRIEAKVFCFCLTFGTGLKTICLRARMGWSHEDFAVKGLKLDYFHTHKHIHI